MANRKYCDRCRAEFVSAEKKYRMVIQGPRTNDLEGFDLCRVCRNRLLEFIGVTTTRFESSGATH